MRPSAEISLARARALFADLQFNPSVLRDVSQVDTATAILGTRSEQPFAFAPTGFTRLMHHEGERAVARVAAALRRALRAVDDGDDVHRGRRSRRAEARKWFQLYVWRDRAAASDLIARAQAAGFEALILTVDVPVAGPRLRDVRNGFSIPPRLKAKTVGNAMLHPAWWLNLLTTEPLTFASLSTLALDRRRDDRRPVRPDDDRWTIWPGCARRGTGRSSSRASRPWTTRGGWSTPEPTR